MTSCRLKKNWKGSKEGERGREGGGVGDGQSVRVVEEERGVAVGGGKWRGRMGRKGHGRIKQE